MLYGLAPCIAMVIVFTFLSLGNNALAIILVAINSVCQMLLIPVYAKLLLGEVTFDVLVVGESVLLYLGLPLVAGFLTRRIAVSRMGEEGFKEFKTYLDSLSIIGLLFTLIVMFALKGDLILERPMIILQMAVPMTIFFWVMFAVVYLTSWKTGPELQGLRGRGLQLHGKGFRDRHRHRHHGLQPGRGTRNGRRSADRGARHAGPGLGGKKIRGGAVQRDPRRRARRGAAFPYSERSFSRRISPLTPTRSWI